MSENIVWLGYLLGAGIALGLVYRLGWRITLAIIVGAAASLAIWAITVLAASSDERSPWLQVDLALNGSLGVIFAAAGAAIGAYLRHREARN